MKSLLLVIIAIVLTILVSYLATHSQHQATPLLDTIYFWLSFHKWQIGSLTFLVLGMWSTVVRKRFKIAIVCLILSLSCAFIFPYLYPYLMTFFKNTPS